MHVKPTNESQNQTNQASNNIRISLVFGAIYPDLEIFKLNKSPNNWHALKDLLFQQVSYWFEMMLKDQSNITNSVTSWCVIPAHFFWLPLYSYPTCYSPLPTQRFVAHIGTSQGRSNCVFHPSPSVLHWSRQAYRTLPRDITDLVTVQAIPLPSLEIYWLPQETLLCTSWAAS